MARDSTDAPRRVSIRRVAQAAGVSMSTVSNVLNNPRTVAAQTRQRVETAMTELGFVRNAAARQLRGAVSPVVGCVLMDVSNIFFAEIARGIEDRLAEAGCMMVLCSTDVSASRERGYLRMLEEQAVRGILANPVTADLGELLRIRRRGTHVVLVDRPQGTSDLCAAAVDNVLGGRLAAEHLIELGHRRVGFLTGDVDVPSLVERVEGARQVFAAAGLDPAASIVEIRLRPPKIVEAADDAMDRVLAMRPAPTALMCFNDTVALGAIRGLCRHGVAVPEGMSVVGYDDVHFAAGLLPPLTTVRQPRYQLGWAAADLLLAEGRPGHRHEELLFRPTMVRRASTCPPP